jgi:hypothetical protein
MWPATSGRGLFSRGVGEVEAPDASRGLAMGVKGAATLGVIVAHSNKKPFDVFLL